MIRKILISIVIIFFGCSVAFAASNPLRMKSGSLSPLKMIGGTICCSIDFSRTKANRKPLEEYITQDFGSNMGVFHRYEPEMLQWFMERWDDDIEDGPRATTYENAQFKVVVVVKTLQLGAKSGWGGASISGYAEFYRGDDETPFAVVEILKMNGTQMGGAVYGYLGLKQVFSDLAEYLCDLVYHS